VQPSQKPVSTIIADGHHLRICVAQRGDQVIAQIVDGHPSSFPVPWLCRKNL
jgi:hypothetical protein